MPISKAQLDVWKAREELDRKLVDMTSQQRRKFFDNVLKQAADSGLDLPVAMSTIRP